MSRVGKYPIKIPKEVEVGIEDEKIFVKGTKGILELKLNSAFIRVENKEDQVVVVPLNKSKDVRMLWGTTRSRIYNMVQGVSQGFSKRLDLVGVGYRVSVQGNFVKLNLGFSHDVDFPIPSGINVKALSATSLEISGVNKEAVGQIAADIRSLRPPEPYKGKGVQYEKEYIVRKQGKKK